MDAELIRKYKELRKEYSGEEYKYLFECVPGLENIDEAIAEDEKKAEEEQILDLKGEYWNFASFVFTKLKKKSIFKKWTKEQYDCQFGVCGICHKPITNLHNARVEHIVSRRNYGSNYSNNLVLVHTNCKRKNGEDIEIDSEKMTENRYSERLDEYVSDLVSDLRESYPVKFPDKIFETKK